MRGASPALAVAKDSARVDSDAGDEAPSVAGSSSPEASVASGPAPVPSHTAGSLMCRLRATSPRALKTTSAPPPGARTQRINGRPGSGSPTLATARCSRSTLAQLPTTPPCGPRRLCATAGRPPASSAAQHRASYAWTAHRLAGDARRPTHAMQGLRGWVFVGRALSPPPRLGSGWGRAALKTETCARPV